MHDAWRRRHMEHVLISQFSPALLLQQDAVKQGDLLQCTAHAAFLQRKRKQWEVPLSLANILSFFDSTHGPSCSCIQVVGAASGRKLAHQRAVMLLIKWLSSMNSGHFRAFRALL